MVYIRERDIPRSERHLIPFCKPRLPRLRMLSSRRATAQLVRKITTARGWIAAKPDVL